MFSFACSWFRSSIFLKVCKYIYFQLYLLGEVGWIKWMTERILTYIYSVKLCTSDQKYLLKLWNGLFLLEPNLLKRFSLGEFQNLFRENYESFLDKPVDLEFKNEALDLLAFYFKSDLPKTKVKWLILYTVLYSFHNIKT